MRGASTGNDADGGSGGDDACDAAIAGRVVAEANGVPDAVLAIPPSGVCAGGGRGTHPAGGASGFFSLLPWRAPTRALCTPPPRNATATIAVSAFRPVGSFPVYPSIAVDWFRTGAPT